MGRELRFLGSNTSCTSAFLKTGISPGTERGTPAVPGKVTSGSDVLSGSGGDTVQYSDFQMCLGSKIQSPSPSPRMQPDSCCSSCCCLSQKHEAGWRHLQGRTPSPRHVFDKGAWGPASAALCPPHCRLALDFKFQFA